MPVPKDPEKREEWRKRLGKSLKGKSPWNKGKTGIYSEETLRSMRASMKGRVAWNRGRTGIYHLSLETKQKLSATLKGRKFSKEHREKISYAVSGTKNHNYHKHPSAMTRQKISLAISGEKHPMWGKHHSQEAKTKISIANKGKHRGKRRPHSEATKKKISEACKGRIPWSKGKTGVFSQEALQKIGQAHKGKIISAELSKKWTEMRQGIGNPNWKGGITPLTHRIRNSLQYRLWRSDVFTRDNFTCQDCGDFRGGNLRAHHLKSTSQILLENDIKTFDQAINCEELWNINNGITLCIKCHKKRHQRRSQTLEENEDLSSYRHSPGRNKAISDLERAKEISK